MACYRSCIQHPQCRRAQAKEAQDRERTGPDGIHPRLFCEAVIGLPITSFPCNLYWMNLCLVIGNMTISPHVKERIWHDPVNYRPISLTVITLKAIKPIMSHSIMKHFERNALLSDDQHGFITGRSCTNKLLEAFEFWMKTIGDGDVVARPVPIWTSPRPNKDPHSRLLKTFKAYGIGDRTYAWLTSFLAGRTQYVS